jgi:hypothetical protein
MDNLMRFLGFRGDDETQSAETMAEHYVPLKETRVRCS